MQKIKLGSKDFDTRQEDVKTSTHEEYVIVLSFELLRRIQCTAPILTKSIDFESCKVIDCPRVVLCLGMT